MNIMDCFEALERLHTGKPTRISRPYKINNDTVSLEAGYGRGIIKKTNPTHQLLINAIAEHYGKKYDLANRTKNKLERKCQEVKNLKDMLEEAHGREAMYVKRIIELEAALRNQSNVTPFRYS